MCMETNKKLYIEEMDSPIGPLTAVVSERGLVRIDFGRWEDLISLYEKWAGKYFSSWQWLQEEEKTAELKQQIEEYFAGGRQTFTFQPDFYGTSFQRKVWEAMFKGIPFGETRSYKQIAEAIDSPRAYRAVGGAINKNPVAIIVPCHRVIGSDGSLTGFGGGMDKKEILLGLEKKTLAEG